MASILFLLIGGLVVGGFSAGVLVHFAQREVAWLSFLVSLLGFVLSFGIVTLVPLDVWETLSEAGSHKDADKVHSEVLIDSSWEAIYWATFFLCWFFCPILMEFEAAGDFSVSARIKTSLKRNAVWYAVYVFVALAIGIYIFVVGAVFANVRSICMAASNAWGLMLCTVLMGWGLVAVPRHFWRLANPNLKLQDLYTRAVQMDEARLSAQFDLQDTIAEARLELQSQDMSTWEPKIDQAFRQLQLTLEDCEVCYCEVTHGARRAETGNTPRVQASRGMGSDMDNLVQLHSSLKRSALEARRATCRWQDLVNRCLLLEDIDESLYPSAVELASQWYDTGKCMRLFCKMGPVRQSYHCLVVLWFRYLRSRVYLTLSALCAALSFVIVLGQLTMFSNTWSLSILSLFFTEDHGCGLTQVLAMVPLGYMLCTAYWSVFSLKIAGWYGLYPNHNTDTASLLWCASILARLAAPLCYHFLLLVRVKGTAFQTMMGQMNVVPVVGQSFNEVFPCLVGVLCVCNLLNVYSRLVKLLGVTSLEFDAGSSMQCEGMDMIAEGRRLTERERRRRSEDRLLEMQSRENGGRTAIPLRLQIQRLIEEGLLPHNWNEYST